MWHSSLSQENIDDLERIQKSAFKVILQGKYKGYKDVLERLDMETLAQRRETLNFAMKCTTNKKNLKMFPKNVKKRDMNTRNPD